MPEAPFDSIPPSMDAVFAAVAVDRRQQEAAFGGKLFEPGAILRNPGLYAHALAQATMAATKALRAGDMDAVYTATTRGASVFVGMAEAFLPAGASAAEPAVPEHEGVEAEEVAA